MKWESQKDAFNISMLMHVEVLSLLRNNTLPKNIPVSRKQDISTYFTANVAFGLFLKLSLYHFTDYICLHSNSPR